MEQTQENKTSDEKLYEVFKDHVVSNLEKYDSLPRNVVYQTLFEAVADKTNWKIGTNKYRTPELSSALLMATALAHHTGGFEVEQDGDDFIVTSLGYYYYIGA